LSVALTLHHSKMASAPRSLNLLDERCGGVFDDIDAVIPAAERNSSTPGAHGLQRAVRGERGVRGLHVGRSPT